MADGDGFIRLVYVMRTQTLAVLMAFAAAVWPAFDAFLFGQRLGATVQDSVAPLSWMAGCWQQRDGTRSTDEQWMRPAGSAMIGMSRTVAGDRLRAWEALRIVRENGRVVFVAQPNGGAPTGFSASRITDTLAVFENPTHDFPQRIAYRRVGTDSLIASICGARNGTVQRMDIPMRRIACVD